MSKETRGHEIAENMWRRSLIVSTSIDDIADVINNVISENAARLALYRRAVALLGKLEADGIARDDNALCVGCNLWYGQHHDTCDLAAILAQAREMGDVK